MGCGAAFQGPGGTLHCAQGKAVLELGRGFSPSYDDQSAATGLAMEIMNTALRPGLGLGPALRRDLSCLLSCLLHLD